jgi:NADH-quinone oxidoreductase subunit G
MCDEGMLTYKEAHDGRVIEPKVRGATTSTSKALDEVKKLFAGVPKEGVGIVLSAQHCLEDNWALLELARVLIETTHVFESGKRDGYEDTILIHRDKNPNTKGVAQLAPGAKPIQALLDDVAAGRITHVLALGGVAPVDADALRAAKLVTIAAHAGPLTEIATVLLPATSWAEQSGTYVNAKGMRQVSEKAIEPLGVSKAGWRQVSDVASALGYEAQWTKLKHIRAQLIGGAAAEAAIRPAALGRNASAE